MTTATSKTRTRKATSKKATKKTANAARHEPNRGEIEAALIERYPHVVPGSLLLAGEKGGAEKKRTVRITCAVCHDTRRRVATSDLFQSTLCGSKECAREHRNYKKAQAENE